MGMVEKTLIVESELLARKANSVFQKYNIKCAAIATSGHLFHYERKDARTELVANNQMKVSQVQQLDGKKILVATDPDQQGHLIAAHIRALTPNSQHERIILNDASEMGILRAFNAPNTIQFCDNEGLKSAFIAMINLEMQNTDLKTFITTTSIEIAKQHQRLGACDNVQEHRYRVDGYEHSLIIPSQFGDPIKCEKTTPFTSKVAIIDNALSNRPLTAMDLLQDAYINGKLSYSRTPHTTLPSNAESILRDYTLDGELPDIQRYFDDSQLVPHFAIHNLAPATTALERYIKAVNRSALKTDDNAIAKFKFEGNVGIHSRTILGSVKHLAPSHQLAFLLAQSPESSPATIQSAAQKYTRHFFNGTWRNEKLLTATLKRAEKEYPQIVEHGLQYALERIINTVDPQKKNTALVLNQRSVLNAEVADMQEIVNVSLK